LLSLYGRRNPGDKNPNRVVLFADPSLTPPHTHTSSALTTLSTQSSSGALRYVPNTWTYNIIIIYAHKYTGRRARYTGSDGAAAAADHVLRIPAQVYTFLLNTYLYNISKPNHLMYALYVCKRVHIYTCIYTRAAAF